MKMRKFAPTTLLGAVAMLVGTLSGPGASASFNVASQSMYASGAHCHSPIGRTGNERASALNAAVATLRQHGVSGANLDSVLAQKLCVVRIDSGGKELASSTNSDVYLTPPKIYYDSQAHDYYSILYWDWRDYNWSKDYNFDNCSPCSHAIGGTDTQALDFNTSLTMQGYSQAQWGDGGHWGTTSTKSACDGDSYGAAFCRQDQGYKAWNGSSWVYDLNMQHGEVVVDWYHTASGGCKTVQGFGKYGHTWSSTSVNGVSLGPWSIGISWSTSSNNWQLASQPGGSATVC